MDLPRWLFGKQGNSAPGANHKGTFLRTPNGEPQEYSMNTIGIYIAGSLCFIIFLSYSWVSVFGVPSIVPSHKELRKASPHKNDCSIYKALHVWQMCRLAYICFNLSEAQRHEGV